MLSPGESLLVRPLSVMAEMGIRNRAVRGLFLKMAKKRLYDEVVVKNATGRPRRIQEEKYLMIRNLLSSIEKMFREHRLSHEALNGVLENLVIKVLLNDIGRRRKALQEDRRAYPGFLTISPTKACNLCCRGCYAASSSKETVQLDYEIFSRIIEEKTRLWNSHFCVISGGEPFLYRDGGKELLDIAREHTDNYFLVYTNGTLIDRQLASELASVGNITPAISVEGMEKETDERRGRGVHRKILNAMKNLRESGIPFGISVTATRHNADMVVSDRFVDFYFEQQGAAYAWIFQYLPIGRQFDVDLMVTPQQRLNMYRREQYLIRDRGYFLADFWNSGAVSNGCISAGRSGGYLYIDWKGDVMPCVFFPYTVDNIVEVYKQGRDLNSVLSSTFFESLREWQREYGYLKPAHEVGNLIVPCPYRDHYGMAHQIAVSCHARPADSAAAEALVDETYCHKMVDYGRDVSEVFDDIWNRLYIGPEQNPRETVGRA
jgi:MoaA/NifB/PqqE/SkfB family radical SAM enzyme